MAEATFGTLANIIGYGKNAHPEDVLEGGTCGIARRLSIRPPLI
jgi:hypothetical protein